MSFVDPERPFESLSEHFGLPLSKTQRRRSMVVRKELEDPAGGKVVVYFKLYGYRSTRRILKRLFKPTRSRGELTNLKFFRELGIPACEPIVQGEYRNGIGIARNCLLMTRELTGTEQLDVFIDQLALSEESESMKAMLRRQIIDSIAGSLRKIHARKFFHADLKWRNVLVRRVGEGGARVEVFWIDCPNGYFDRTGGFRCQHGKIKDLATMDYRAKDHCTREERLYFLSVYSGLSLEDPALKDLGEQVVDYRTRMLDAKWAAKRRGL